MNKLVLWWLVILALVSLNLAYALASGRLKEMVKAIEEQVEDAEEQGSLIEAVEEYIQERDAALTTLAALARATSEGEMEGEWQSTVAAISGIPGLADVDDDLASEAALTLYDQFMDEEQAWVSALSVLETAAYRDDLVGLRVRLANMTQELEEEWEKTLNADGQIDEKQWKVMADIYGILAVFAKESDGKRQFIRNNIQILTDLLSKVDVVSGNVPGEVANAIKQALSIIAETAKQYNSYKTTVETLRPQLRELAGQELVVLVLFNETRKSTQRFVEENGFNIMKSHYAEAEDELKAFGGAGTSGQRDDAKVFVEAARDALSDHVAEGKMIFEAFVTKHELKFFGPVGPDIKKFLVESEVWQAEADKVEALDLEEFLSALRSDANGFFGVSLSVDGITDYEREFINEQLRNDLGALQKAIDEAGVAFSTENLMLIYDRRDIEEAVK